MAERARVETAVFEAIDKMNTQLPKGIVIEKTSDATLYGKTGKLESLDFVAFIMEVETAIQNEFGVDFMLTDEDLLSKEKSPFLTVGSLIDHLVESVEVDE
jgi:acyl carrier protein